MRILFPQSLLNRKLVVASSVWPWFCACEMWQQCACEMRREMCRLPAAGCRFVCSKSVLKLCQSYLPTALSLSISLWVFLKTQKKEENNRKIASRRIFDFFSAAFPLRFLLFSLCLCHLSNCITYSYAGVWAMDICAGELSRLSL